MNKKAHIRDFTEYMSSIKPKSYRPHVKLKCDWSDKQYYLVHYRPPKFLVRERE